MEEEVGNKLSEGIGIMEGLVNLRGSDGLSLTAKAAMLEDVVGLSIYAMQF